MDILALRFTSPENRCKTPAAILFNGRERAVTAAVGAAAAVGASAADRSGATDALLDGCGAVTASSSGAELISSDLKDE